MPVQINVTPSSALVDDFINIFIKGLDPWKSVTLAAVLVEDENVFVSHAFYVSHGDGTLDLNTSASHGGSYNGIEPMGLFWGMKPAPGQMRGLRLIKRDIEKPFIVNLYVVSGHQPIISQDDVSTNDDKILATINVERFYMAPDVTCFNVRAGNIRGKLFLPPGDGPFPGVVDMFGTVGGIVTFRSALLASRGFAALSLPYFGYEDLPAGIELNLEYFEEAVDWLHSHPSVMKSGVGVIGVSKGGSLAMYMGTVCSKVKAVVNINGPAIQTTGLHFYQSIPQPVFNGAAELYCGNEDGDICMGDANSPYLENASSAIIPVEKAENCEFLLINCEDDPSELTEHLEVIIDRFERNRCTNYRMLRYFGAGHLLEPPYMPLCRVAYAKLVGCPVIYGGEMRSHAEAQDHAWQETLNFFWQRLNPGQQNKWRRCVPPANPKYTTCLPRSQLKSKI